MTTLQERLRGNLQIGSRALSVEAADALDAQGDKINRLSVRCESQRLKIEEQAERIKALEGALRLVVDEWDNDYCVDYADVIEDARLVLMGDGIKPHAGPRDAMAESIAAQIEAGVSQRRD